VRVLEGISISGGGDHIHSSRRTGLKRGESRSGDKTPMICLSSTSGEDPALHMAWEKEEKPASPKGMKGSLRVVNPYHKRSSRDWLVVGVIYQCIERVRERKERGTSNRPGGQTTEGIVILGRGGEERILGD